MVNSVLVDKTLQGTKIITARGAEFGDNLHVVEVVPREFSSLCAFYPILITSNADSGAWTFVSILGFEPGENLYLEGDAWDAGYVPLTVRRQPFQVVPQQITEEDGSTSTVPALAIDLDSPRVNKKRGEDLLDENGDPTEWFKSVNALVSQLVEGTSQARQLLAKLEQLELIEPLQFGVALADGKARRLEGLNTINEVKLRELDDQTVLELHRLGYLDCIYSMRASLGQLGALSRRKNARVRASAS